MEIFFGRPLLCLAHMVLGPSGKFFVARANLIDKEASNTQCAIQGDACFLRIQISNFQRSHSEDRSCTDNRNLLSFLAPRKVRLVK
mmetsp:Transcript_80165/g.159995  ORF Transcript_80165/g.159995 Transcript_80165/m.159995 type:complete len:86 (-) Transcript_80165:2756-3013(-)